VFNRPVHPAADSVEGEGKYSSSVYWPADEALARVETDSTRPNHFECAQSAWPRGVLLAGYGVVVLATQCDNRTENPPRRPRAAIPARRTVLV